MTIGKTETEAVAAIGAARQAKHEGVLAVDFSGLRLSEDAKGRVAASLGRAVLDELAKTDIGPEPVLVGRLGRQRWYGLVAVSRLPVALQDELVRSLEATAEAAFGGG